MLLLPPGHMPAAASLVRRAAGVVVGTAYLFESGEADANVNQSLEYGQLILRVSPA